MSADAESFEWIVNRVTRAYHLEALRMLGEGQGPYKDQRTGFLSQIELKRSDFGMTYLIDNSLVGDAVGITVSFEGAQQEQQAAPARTGAARQ